MLFGLVILEIAKIQAFITNPSPNIPKKTMELLINEQLISDSANFFSGLHFSLASSAATGLGTMPRTSPSNTYRKVYRFRGSWMFIY